MAKSLSDEFVELLQLARQNDAAARTKLQSYASVPANLELMKQCDAEVIYLPECRLKVALDILLNSTLTPMGNGKAAVRIPQSDKGRDSRHRFICSVCGNPAIPGDSVCYAHNRH